MTKPMRSALTPATTSRAHAPEPESLDDLRQDCARMSAHWTAAHPGGAKGRAVEPAMLHGVTVPPRSAQLLDGMSDYGD